MSFTPAFPDDHAATMVPDLEDFRRLGVRPFECRQSVIRLAALRSTRPLAKQQLVSPTQQGHLQLVRLVTSTYRLLDPRGRQDGFQRALVGRIMPQDLIVAGRTHFGNTTELPADSTRTISHGTDSDDEFQQGLAGEMDAQPTWTISLGEGDLVRRNSVIGRIGHASRVRRFGNRRSRFSKHWWVLATSVVLVLVAVSLLFHVFHGSAVASRAKTSEEIRQRSSHKSVQPADFATPGQSRNAQPAREDRITQGQPQIGSSTAIDLKRDAKLPVSEPALPSRVKLAPMLEIERTEKEAGDSESDNTKTSNTTDTPVITSPAAVPASSPVNPPRVRSFPVPNAQQADSARRRIERQVSALSKSIVVDSVADRIQAVSDFADQQSIGSDDHWTSLQIICEHVWLMESLEEMASRIEVLCQDYHFDHWQTLTTTFVGACNLARLPATHQHLAKQGLRLCDRLLCEELLTECGSVLDVLDNLDRSVEHDVRKREYAESIELMERLVVSTNRWRAVGDQSVPTADTGIAGRYYCLMLRQWKIGLPWLTELSDKRLARLAMDEVSADDEERQIEIANRWLDLADRFQGRSAHSIRLHAIDLLNQSINGASEIQKLAMERSIDEALAILPFDLREIPVSSDGVMGIPRVDSDAEPSDPDFAIAEEFSPGLSGRLTIDGQDVGVRVSYQPGILIDPSLMPSIMQRLDSDGESVSLELLGRIELPSSTQVSIAFATKSGTKQEVRVDGDLITPNEFDQVTLIRLQAGTRTISWKIQSNPLDQLFFDIRDANTGQSIPVVYHTTDQDMPTKFTVNVEKSER